MTTYSHNTANQAWGNHVTSNTVTVANLNVGMITDLKRRVPFEVGRAFLQDDRVAALSFVFGDTLVSYRVVNDPSLALSVVSLELLSDNSVFSNDYIAEKSEAMYEYARHELDDDLAKHLLPPKIVKERRRQEAERQAQELAAERHQMLRVYDEKLIYTQAEREQLARTVAGSVTRRDELANAVSNALYESRGATVKYNSPEPFGTAPLYELPDTKTFPSPEKPKSTKGMFRDAGRWFKSKPGR